MDSCSSSQPRGGFSSRGTGAVIRVWDGETGSERGQVILAYIGVVAGKKKEWGKFKMTGLGLVGMTEFLVQEIHTPLEEGEGDLGSMCASEV